MKFGSLNNSKVRLAAFVVGFLVAVSGSRASGLDFGSYLPQSIGYEVVGLPWITDVHIVDLDDDGMKDVVVCDGRLNQVSWIRQESPGVYVEQDIGDAVAGPAHAETVDIDGDGDLDVLVSCLGLVPPNNAKIGSVVVLENLGGGSFANRVLLEQVPRVSYVGAGDLDGDGDLDLSVGLFGMAEGEIRWLENLGDWQFKSHGLLDYSGTIHAPIADIDLDGDLDIVALVSQDWEEIHAFENDGKGRFGGSILFGALNRNYDSSGIQMADIDSDGDLDIAYTNGDGFDYSTPGSRPWHGVQWLENDGSGDFQYHRVGDLCGAYSPHVADFDGDGDQDIMVVSGFNEWSDPEAYSLVLFQREEGNSFKEVPLARKPTHLVTLDAADMDGDGTIELVTGGFHFAPTMAEASRVSLWSVQR